MPRGVVDYEGLRTEEANAIRAKSPTEALSFNITKIGHVVLFVSDLDRSVDFYTQVLGFKVSDVYPTTMMDGGMVFMRCNNDHHGVALVGGAGPEAPKSGMHHMAFEVDTIDEVFKARDHLNAHDVKIEFEGRRRAGVQVAVEFRDPDGHFLEIYWGLDQVGADGVVREPEEWCEEFSLEEAVDNPPPGQDTTLADPSLRRD